MSDTIDESQTQPERRDISDIAKEILEKRTAWYFKGICATGTKYPDGKNTAPGADVTGGGSDASKYYGETGHYSEKVPQLFYASTILDKAYPENGDPSTSDPKTVVLSRVTSKVEGEDEIVIAGKCATLDSRGSTAPFVLTQRVNHDLAGQLMETIRENPNSFDEFLKTTFPGMDSSKENYDGLYRMMADKLILLDSDKIREFATKFPAKPDSFRPGKFDDPRVTQNDAKEFLDHAETKILLNPTGSGTIEDYIPIKKRIWATLAK